MPTITTTDKTVAVIALFVALFTWLVWRLAIAPALDRRTMRNRVAAVPDPTTPPDRAEAFEIAVAFGESLRGSATAINRLTRLVFAAFDVDVERAGYRALVAAQTAGRYTPAAADAIESLCGIAAGLSDYALAELTGDLLDLADYQRLTAPVVAFVAERMNRQQ